MNHSDAKTVQFWNNYINYMDGDVLGMKIIYLILKFKSSTVPPVKLVLDK